MDIHGNPEDRDIHGNSPRDVWGNPQGGDVYGNPPRDVHGNYQSQNGNQNQDGGGIIERLFKLFGG